MKKAIAHAKAHRAAIIKRSLVVAGTVVAITLVGYVATRHPEVLETAADAVAE